MKSTRAFKIMSLAVAGLAFSVQADNPHTYAVMSLIGDSISFVTGHPVTGSLIDQNGHQTFDLPPAAIDHVALLAADDAIKKTQSGASTVLLESVSKELRDRQSALIEGGHLADSAELIETLKQSGADDLVLMTKHRAEAALQTDRETLGNGTLYGLGYYVDRHKRLWSKEGVRAEGYLAPYTYFNIYLIDLATLSVRRERTITSSRTISNAENSVSSSPWDILSNADKVRVLDEMVRRQITRAVPELLR